MTTSCGRSWTSALSSSYTRLDAREVWSLTITGSVVASSVCSGFRSAARVEAAHRMDGGSSPPIRFANCGCLNVGSLAHGPTARSIIGRGTHCSRASLDDFRGSWGHLVTADLAY